MPSEPSSDALDAACEAFDNAYEAEIQIGADTYTSNSRQAIAAAIAAYEAAAWSSDMDAVPRDGLIDLIACGHRYCDCYYDQITDQWRTSRPAGRLFWVYASAVTHWRLPPTLPSPEPVDATN